MTPQRTFRAAALLLAGLLCCAAALAGCDSTDADADGDANADTGTFRLLLTDAPLDDIVEAHVVIDRIELRGTEGTLVLADTPQAFDLLTLQNGVTATLADFDVPDGTYQEVRLFVAEEAHVVYDDGTEEQLKVPGGTQSGLKIRLGNLAIDEDVVEVTLDFDVSESFVRRGNSGKGYIFKPVIKPLSILVNGEPVVVEDDGDADD